MFPNFDYLKIKNLAYPDQKPVEFYKILRSECKIRREYNYVDEIVSILYGILFRVNELFLRKILVKNMKSIFHEIWGFFKKRYQQNRSIYCF